MKAKIEKKSQQKANTLDQSASKDEKKANVNVYKIKQIKLNFKCHMCNVKKKTNKQKHKTQLNIVIYDGKYMAKKCVRKIKCVAYLEYKINSGNVSAKMHRRNCI